MKDIIIKVIPHGKQRYDTIGDYFEIDGITHFRVSDMGSDDYAFMVAIHELIEWYLTQKRGISIKKIDAFDKKFERERMRGEHGDGEPGDSKKAPYYKEHQYATSIERLLAVELGVDWNDYDSSVNDL